MNIAPEGRQGQPPRLSLLRLSMSQSLPSKQEQPSEIAAFTSDRSEVSELF
jgi:hypothetical protein